MKLLLDTHAFLWLDNEPSRLSSTIQALCQDPETEMLISAVSIWEIQIKSALGKLNLRRPLQQLLDDQMQVNALTVAPITVEHVFALDRLPSYHKDPFDRLIIAQAIVEDLTLASADLHVMKCPVALVW